MNTDSSSQVAGFENLLTPSVNRITQTTSRPKVSIPVAEVGSELGIGSQNPSHDINVIVVVRNSEV